MSSIDMNLDPLGEQPALFKLYTQIAFLFQFTSHAPSPDFIVSTITRGLEGLSEAFPWVAGQVVNVNTETNSPPVYKIRSLELAPHLIVKDYTSDPFVPTFEAMKTTHYPFSLFGEDIWAPCPTLAGLVFDSTKPSGSVADTAPVMLVQASFIRGGMVLCVNMQHNVADMIGQGAIIELLSKACRGERYTEEERKIGNIERKGLIPLIREEGWKPGRELDKQLIPLQSASSPEEVTTQSSDAAKPDTYIEPPRCTWTYFNFSASALKELKDVATKTLPKKFRGYITTDDAISALIYQSVLRARYPRLSSSPDREVTFARAVDARRYLNVPATYPGMLQNMTYTGYPLKRVLEISLGEIAAEMREQVDPKKSRIAYNTRSLITFVSQNAENRLRANVTATLKLDADIMLSSWSKINAYELDFGLGLGLPEVVRRPGFVPVESLMYLMPKARDGEIAAAVCLREEDLERLRRDEEFGKFATYIG